MFFAHAPTATSLLIGLAVTMLDLFMYSQHRMNANLASLNAEIAEQRRQMEQDLMAAHLRAFYLAPNKYAALCSIAAMLQSTYRELSPN
jgi:hypothetical protein